MTFRDHLQDAALDNLAQEQRVADGLTTDVLGSMAQQIAALRQEVARQNAALSTLTQLLMEKGVVNSAELKSRFDQAMASAQAQANVTACTRCRKQVDKRQTQITSSGAMCVACYQAMQADDE